MTEIEKNIIIKALKIRASKGENVNDIIKNYIKLTDKEKYEIKNAVMEV